MTGDKRLDEVEHCKQLGSIITRNEYCMKGISVRIGNTKVADVTDKQNGLIWQKNAKEIPEMPRSGVLHYTSTINQSTINQSSGKLWDAVQEENEED